MEYKSSGNRTVYFCITIAFTLSVLFAPWGMLQDIASGKSSYIIQGQDSSVVAGLVETHGGKVSSNLHIIQGVAAWLTPDQFEALSRHPGILAISPNATVSLTGIGADAAIMNKFTSPKSVDQIQTNYPDVVGADVVWTEGVTGDGVTVAVIDSGLENLDGIQEDIYGNKERLLAWVDFVQDKEKPKDKNGHGTHISGIIANTQMGSDGEWNGIAPGVDLVGVRVLNKEGYGTYEQVIQGIQWVIDHKNAYNIRVINLSLVSEVHSPYWADPLNQAVMRAWAEGIVVVVAAGNGGPDPMTIGVPGNNPYVITVGAFTDNYTPYDWSDDYITPFSAAGPTLDGFAKPDVVAPGAHILSLMEKEDYLTREYPETYAAKNYYGIAGTSQASAVVSGIAALAISHNPDLTPDQVKYHIMYASGLFIDPVSTEALYSLWQQGAGRVNAPGAVFGEFDDGYANAGLDIWADLTGDTHYQGYSYFDEETGEFRLYGDYNSWTGGYGSWAGGYGSWAGGYGSWAGGYGSWAGGYGSWAGDYGAWLGGYGSWAGGYGSWAGGYGSWAGGYGSWAGSYGSWAGGYGSWAGGYGSWAGTEPWIGSIYADEIFIQNFLAGIPPDTTTTTTSISIEVGE